jgi:hypothetical protein
MLARAFRPASSLLGSTHQPPAAPPQPYLHNQTLNLSLFHKPPFVSQPTARDSQGQDFTNGRPDPRHLIPHTEQTFNEGYHLQLRASCQLRKFTASSPRGRCHTTSLRPTHTTLASTFGPQSKGIPRLDTTTDAGGRTENATKAPRQPEPARWATPPAPCWTISSRGPTVRFLPSQSPSAMTGRDG